jgi:signal transduction histidine kinase
LTEKASISREKRKRIERDYPDAGKPFRLATYLSLCSVVVVLVCAFLLSVFVSQRTKQILLKKQTQYAFLMGKNLNHQVYFRFVLPTYASEGEVRLSRETHFMRLDRVVRTTIHGLDIEKLNIYDPDQVLTYSTERDKVGSKGAPDRYFGKAMKGEYSWTVEHEGGSFMGIVWGDRTRKLKTYMPMWAEFTRSTGKPNILGVFEIIQDVTSDHAAIFRFQRILLGISLLFGMVVFFSIMIIARRAEKNIAARAAERRKFEEQLDQADRLAALGEMIAGVSHEIRNPLGIIQSTSEILCSRAENERQKKLSGVIQEEAVRLNNILTEFLDFARPKTLQAGPCRLEDVVEHNLQLIEAECERRSIHIQRDYGTTDGTVEADADLLYRALVNIFSNSMEAMPSGGELRVSTRLVSNNGGNSPEMELTIEDTGVGIGEDAIKKIFNPFFTTREKGTGLGLAIVRSIVDSHNGRIDVYSEEGNGTRIVIRLPRNQEPVE